MITLLLDLSQLWLLITWQRFFQNLEILNRLSLSLRLRNFLLMSAFAIDWASCSPDSGDWFPRIMTLWLVVLMLRISALERLDDSGNLLKEKTQMAFGLAVGLSKPDWCRLEFYGWPWHSALVSEHCIGRGVDSWGSEIWTIAICTNAENKYNVFRLIWFSQVELENMFLILVSLRKIAFLSLIFSPCQGLKSNLEAFGIKNWYLDQWLRCFALWALTKSLKTR